MSGEAEGSSGQQQGAEAPAAVEEQPTTAPEPSAPTSIDEVREEARVEGRQAALGADDAEPSAEEIRQVLGEDEFAGLDDEQVVEQYRELVGTADEVLEEEEESSAESSEPSIDLSELGFDLLDEEGEPLDPERLTETTLSDALESIKIRYKAGGQERADALADLVRLAQRVPTTDRRNHELMSQRNETAKELEQAEAELQELKSAQKLWHRALADPTGQVFEELRQQYQQALVEGEEPEEATKPGKREGKRDLSSPDSISDEEKQRQGERFYMTRIKPVLNEMAQTYSQDGSTPEPAQVQEIQQSLDAAFRELVANEGRFMADPDYGPQRLKEIIEDDLPTILERNGYRKVQGARRSSGSGSESSEVSELKKEVQLLKAKLAKQRLDEAPGSGSRGTSTPGPSSAKVEKQLENAGSYAEVKELMRTGELEFEV